MTETRCLACRVNIGVRDDGWVFCYACSGALNIIELSTISAIRKNATFMRYAQRLVGFADIIRERRMLA